MNEVLKAMKERRSIRKFKSDMLPKEIIDKVIESGLYAASGKGQQSPIIICYCDTNYYYITWRNIKTIFMKHQK